MKPADKLPDREKPYSDAELRVFKYNQKFDGVPEVVENAAIALDMLYDRWDDFIDLEEYMSSGQWLEDYEADERGELGPEIPKAVLSQDELYDALTSLDSVLKDMRRLVRHYKSKSC